MICPSCGGPMPENPVVIHEVCGACMETGSSPGALFAPPARMSEAIARMDWAVGALQRAPDVVSVELVATCWEAVRADLAKGPSAPRAKARR